MGDPFGPVRDAVAGYAATSSPRPAGPAPTFLGSLPAVGVYNVSAGLLVATFGAVPYTRQLEALAVTCDEVAAVHLYVGAVAPAGRISSFPDGSMADFSPPIPRIVPAGSALFVVWEVTSSASAGAANAQLRQVTS